jgi:RHS repeat-associated protein
MSRKASLLLRTPRAVASGPPIDQAAGAANNNVPQSIVFAYDAAGRRIRTTYMNGITRDNSYDDAGQLTAITYTNADGSVLGDLAYTYDNGGRRIATSGSLARTALPDVLPDAAVDAANRLTAAGTQTLTYDANGNLSGDGSRQFVWNARNQLVQIKDSAGAVIAAFTYDALGRGQTKTVDGVATGYVYDGWNIVQELAGAASANSDPATVKASYVGAGLDEVFAQLSGTGQSAAILTYLTDALGSTIRLVDAAGAKVVEYTYDPYGNTTADAAASNPFQYTGRENDGTGLNYYRARYYSPNLARFISSDPIGLDGGINSYGYAAGNPIIFTDPNGLSCVYIQATGSISCTNAAGHNYLTCRGDIRARAMGEIILQLKSNRMSDRYPAGNIR